MRRPSGLAGPAGPRLRFDGRGLSALWGPFASESFYLLNARAADSAHLPTVVIRGGGAEEAPAAGCPGARVEPHLNHFRRVRLCAVRGRRTGELGELGVGESADFADCGMGSGVEQTHRTRAGSLPTDT